MQLVRKIIYTPSINYLITRSLKLFKPILPEKAKIPVAGIMTVEVNETKKIRMATNQTNCLTKDVFWEGIKGYEYAVIKIFVDLIKDMHCFIDVGANIGYYSLIAGVVNDQIKCYCFEPMPAALHFLKRNIKLNGLTTRVFPIGLAASNETGEVKFFVTKNAKAPWLKHHIGGSSSSARPKDDHSETIQVKTETLDNFIKNENITNVDFLKLDTEATEDLVLDGAKKLLEFRPIIMCEVLPGRIEHKLQEIFAQNNYRFFLPTIDGLVEINQLDNIPNKDKDLLFFPSEKEDLINKYLAGKA